MSKPEYCYLYLTCKDTVEASTIATTLLEKSLVVCVKQMSIESDFRWKDKIEHNGEVLLIMESAMDLFDKVEAEVAKLHSYETFVLEAVPIAKVSKKAQAWLEKELHNG